MLKVGDIVSYREYPDFLDEDIYNEGIGMVIEPQMGDGIVGLMVGDKILPVFADCVNPL